MERGRNFEPQSTLARVFSFDVKFTGAKRTQFYRKLFGFVGKARRSSALGPPKTYTYAIPGLLSSIPHIRLGKSVIAVPLAAAPKLEEFFSSPRWRPMELYSFDAILPADLRLKAMEASLSRYIPLERGQRTTLAREISDLRALLARGEMGEAVLERARHMLRAADELMQLDWTDGRKFSIELEAKLAEIRKRI
ncbi:MAG: hypothetical protein NZ934_04870 [Hadesarchaea archaeon]|nr:hypothetical protein [Hadesarchaea archaeon]